MASNLACVGLAVADTAELTGLIRAVLPDAAVVGSGQGVELLRWEDPSGARLLLHRQEGQIRSVLPSYSGEPSTRVAAVHRANPTVAVADVTDERGEVVTRLALELEQMPLLTDALDGGAPAAITFLGRKVTVHPDAAAFGRSPDSLLDPNADPNRPPPAHVAERGLAWPPRLGAESFLSYGVFGEPEQANAWARVAGTVLRAERRTVERTGQRFVVATVRTLGMVASVCLSGVELGGELAPGNVVSGDVYVVGSVPVLERPSPSTRWWRRRS